jgi:alpha-N-arabinofuranosidase
MRSRLSARRWSSSLLLILAWPTVAVDGTAVAMADAPLKVSTRPLHDGRINPMLFGNFIELLDDLVPGMWAEMLNDRGFEGVTQPARWVYYDGSPTVCDRQWDKGDDWVLETAGAFNGPRCARITGREDRTVGLTQSGLAVHEGSSYDFSAYLRSDGRRLRIQAVLKTALPDGRVAELASAELPTPPPGWTRFSVQLKATGTTDRAVFELRVLGKGTLWADKLSLRNVDNRQGWRKDVVEAIQASRPAVIRWGGSAVDPGKYRWKNGIGDRDRRVPFANVNWGRIDSNDVGIDEFCQFCALVGAEPLVCLSFSDGPASAADLVQYCNGDRETKWGARRAASGHVEPYRVKYWQLGNEISGDDVAYIQKCKDFIRRMKKADTTIVLISSFPSQNVFNVIGRDLAYVAPHHYTRDLAACEAEFKKLSRMIATTPGCGHIRIAVTEWNFTAGDWGLLRGKMLTLEGALLNAKYLNLLCRYSNIVDIGCRSNMTNSFCSGIIGTNPAGLLKRPSYHVMRLYADHARPIPLKLGVPPAGVDVVACATEDRRSVCLFAVNTRNEPVVVSLDLAELGESFAPLSAETVCDTLDMRQPDVMNHWTATERVRTVNLPVVANPVRVNPVRANEVTLPALSVSAVTCGQIVPKVPK